MRVGVACSGGGLKGVALHAGFFEAMAEMGVAFHAVSGTSAGGIAAGYMGSGLTAKEHADVIRSLRLSDYVGVSVWDQLMAIKNRWKGWTGFISGTPMRQFIRRTVKTALIEECPVPTLIVTFDITAQKKRVLRSGMLEQAMRASSAIPFVWEAEKYSDGHYLWDGGGVSNLPAYELASAVADLDLIIVSAVMNLQKEPASNNDFIGERYSFVEAAERYVHAISEELLKSNLDLADNDTPIFAVQHPGFSMGLFDVDRIGDAIDIGRETTKKQITEFLKAPAVLDREKSLADRIRGILSEVVK